MNNIRTENIKIWGIVQGVGFRPFVAKTAEKLSMKGEVLNLGGLVALTVTDTEERITAFLETIGVQKPAPAEIVHISRKEIPYREFTQFTIRRSKDLAVAEEAEDAAVMIPADLALCPDCLREMNTPGNRRYRHPFISCMVCGPRYTIIKNVPYDRDTTVMDVFPMCGECGKEYKDIRDRRHHAQTISCHDCGPYMKTRGSIPGELTWEAYAASLLQDGRVIAFKSMGGYHLMADAKNPRALAALRSIKRRDEKPFAVMFASTEEMEDYCQMGETEIHLLESSPRPILLLVRKENAPSLAEPEKSRFVGAFLPALGGQYMLLEAFGGPLVATSANRSDLPILTREEEIFCMMDQEPLIGEVFYHDREIIAGLDDSVVRVIDGQPQMLRRSKGYAPVPLYVKGEDVQILAVGPQLKNAFALAKGPYVYPSQYFGDLDSMELVDRYMKNLDRMETFFGIRPEGVACDMHPGYETTKIAKAYAKERNLPVYPVQHHHAHVASVMAEHNLTGDVIGVSFDGTGYGTDGKIWGGEFLLCNGGGMERLAHLRYIRMIGGDASMKDGMKSAWSLVLHHEKQDSPKEDAQGPRQLEVALEPILAYAKTQGTIRKGDSADVYRKALEFGMNVIESSSMGRLFDGVSALLGICSYNRYEGQSAMLLEDAAQRGRDCPGRRQADDLAFRFHLQIAEMIRLECMEIRENTGANQVALTGGVFQNKILMEESLSRLRKEGFEPYYNISVSPNDGGIALGQVWVARFQAKKAGSGEVRNKGV